MLTDNFCIFTDNEKVRVSMSSQALKVPPFSGRGEPVNIAVLVTEPYSAGVKLKIALQEAGADGVFSDAAIFDCGELDKSEGIFNFTLPANLKGSQLRLDYRLTGASATGKLFAGITGDMYAGYGPGLYKNAGRTVG